MFMVLGTSTLIVGLIESMTESTALIVKVFYGVLSDCPGKRKVFAVFWLRARRVDQTTSCAVPYDDPNPS